MTFKIAGSYDPRAVRDFLRAVTLCSILMTQFSCAATGVTSAESTFGQLGLTGGAWDCGNLRVLVASVDRRSGILIEADRSDVVLRGEWREFDLDRTDLVKVYYVECNKDIVGHETSDALDATSEITKFIKAKQGVVRMRAFGEQNEYGRPLASYSADVELIDVRIECAGHPPGPWVISDALMEVRVSIGEHGAPGRE